MSTMPRIKDNENMEHEEGNRHETEGDKGATAIFISEKDIIKIRCYFIQNEDLNKITPFCGYKSKRPKISIQPKLLQHCLTNATDSNY